LLVLTDAVHGPRLSEGLRLFPSAAESGFPQEQNRRGPRNDPRAGCTRQVRHEGAGGDVPASEISDTETAVLQ